MNPQAVTNLRDRLTGPCGDVPSEVYVVSTEAALHAPPAPAGPLASPVMTGRGHGSRGGLQQCGGTAYGGAQKAGRGTGQTNSPVGRHGTRLPVLVCAAQRAWSQAERVAFSALASRLELAPHCPETRAAWRSQHGSSECRHNCVSTVGLHDTQQQPVTGPHFVTHTSQVKTTAAEGRPRSQEWQREHSLRLPARKLGAQPADALGGLSLLSWSHGSSAVVPFAALAAVVSPATCRALSAAGL